ncbi:hypothetical protein ACLOJK_009953 [Asimina triloba]
MAFNFQGEIHILAQVGLKKQQKEGSHVSVKVSLSKEELDLLLLRLKEQGGRMRLDHALEEIERRRDERSSCWTPRLDTIAEAPEVQKTDKINI